MIGGWWVGKGTLIEMCFIVLMVESNVKGSSIERERERDVYSL
jgi:hypothetical protein